MKAKPTQCELIVRYLRRGYDMTMMDGLRVARTLNLHRRLPECSRLLSRGESITPVTVTRNGRKLRAWRIA